jgi:hypothetical protein
MKLTKIIKENIGKAALAVAVPAIMMGCATTLKPEVRELNGGVLARACSDVGDVSTKRDMTRYEAETMIADYLTEGKGGEVTLGNTMTRYKRQGDQICAEVYLKK